MTNEEAALAIQSGDGSLVLWLWEHVHGFVRMMAGRRLMLFNTVSADAEDLIQAGYIAMLNAVKTFDPAKGIRFTTWLGYYLRSAFSAAQGLADCVSLDEPQESADGAPLRDLIEDESAAADMEAAEDRIYSAQRQEAVAAILDTLPADLRGAIELRYFDGLSVAEIAEQTGESVASARKRVDLAMSKLRTPKNLKKLRDLVDDITPFYWRVSVAEFSRTHESSVESLVFRREGLENKLIENRGKL